MDIIKGLEIGVYYFPIILFLLFVLSGFIWGLIRGFRKSLILFIQALVAASICLIIFYVAVNNSKVDAYVYSTTSKMVNFNDLIGTSTEYSSMREVLVDLILKNQSYGDGFRMIVEENGAYLDTLVNLSYRIILFIILLILFFILVFIFYIIYLIAYPERRRKAKLNAKERKGEGQGYKKHVLLGGLIGAIRGAFVAVIWLSFIGALFFVVAGGTGEDDADAYPDYTFTDDSINSTYEAYKIIASYGSKGIFRVLNTVKDKENIPFYLFAANMVLSGTYNDEELGIHTTVRFTKEISCYTNFINSTLKLFLKYDEDGSIKEAIDSNDTSKLADLINTLMEKEEFQKEYDELIENFESGTYFINFALSFVNSIVTHRNELAITDNLDQQIIDLLDIVFDGENKITVSNILTEADARQLMKSVVTVLSAQLMMNDDTSNFKKVVLYSNAFVPELLKLSMFNDEARKGYFNPLLQDIYDYLANATINITPSASTKLYKSSFDSTKTINETNAQDIDWCDELALLLNTSLDLLNMVDSVYTDSENVIELIFDIFPDDNITIKNQNLNYYNNLIKNLSNSKLLDSILSMTVIKDLVDESISSISTNIKLPSKIEYVNKYTSTGEVETYGEIYVLLTTLKELIINGNSKDIINNLVEGNYDLSILNSISELFTSSTSDGDKTLIDISLDSTVIKYIISGLILGMSDDDSLGLKIIVPNSLCNLDEEEIKTIKKEELVNLFESLTNTLDIIGEDNSIDFKKLVNNVESLVDSEIIEASVTYLFVDMLSDVELITIPDNYIAEGSLDELINDFENNIWHTSKEIKNIVYAMDEIFNISSSESFDLESSLNNIGSSLNNLNNASIKDTSKTKLEITYLSAIIRATLKNFVTDSLTDELIDKSILSSTALITDIDGVSSLKFEEAENIIYAFNELSITDFSSIDVASFKDEILNLNDISIKDTSKTKLDILYNSLIIRHILDKQLDNLLTDEFISLDIRESNTVKSNEIESDISTYKYYKSSEVSSLLNSVKELDITDFDSINIDDIQNKILDLNCEAISDTSKTKLDIVYNSSIIKYLIAKQLDEAITNELVSNDVKTSALIREDDGIRDEHDILYLYYTKEEVSYIINSLNELDISGVDSIDINVIKGKMSTLNDDAITDNGSLTKIDVLYQSFIIKYALSLRLDETFTSSELNVHNDVLSNSKSNSEISTTYYYIKTSVVEIIDALGPKGLNISNLDDTTSISSNSILNLNEIPTGETDSRLNIVYKSDIFAYILTEKLSQSISSNSILVDDIDAKEYYSINVNLYKENEISVLIDALNDSNITDINSITSSSLALDDTLKIDILNSIILFDSVSKLVFDNNTLKSPLITKTYNSDNTVLKIVDDLQMRYLLDVLIELGVTDFSSNIELTLSDSINENISKSYILRATISDTTLNNAEIKVATSNIDSLILDYDVILESELLNMLNAIYFGLGINDISSIGSDIHLPGKNDTQLDEKISIISASLIIRSTITDKLEFTDSYDNPIDLYIICDDSELLDDIKGGNLLSIKEAEMKKLIKGLVVGFGDDDSTSTGGTIDLAKLKSMSTTERDTFMSSSTILLITDKVLKAYELIYTGSIQKDLDDTYKTSDYTIINYEYLTLECQKDMIQNL